MKLPAAAAAILAIAASLGACDRCGAKKPAQKQADRPARDTPSTTARTGPAREHGPSPMPGKVRLNAPIDPDEATAMLPPFAGSPLGAPTVAANGAQVRFPYCLGGTNLGVAGQRAEQALRDAGWSNVTTRAPDPGASRYAIAADKDDLRLAVTIESSSRPDCDSAVGKFYATAIMNRVAAPSAAP